MTTTLYPTEKLPMFDNRNRLSFFWFDYIHIYIFFIWVCWWKSWRSYRTLQYLSESTSQFDNKVEEILRADVNLVPVVSEKDRRQKNLIIKTILIQSKIDRNFQSFTVK